MIKLNFTIVDGICIGISFVATIVAVASGRKVKRVCENLDRSIEDLCKQDVSVDISKEVVDAAVNELVKREVDKCSNAVRLQVRHEMLADLRDKVSREVNAQYADIKSDVSKEVKDQVGRIDINEIKNRVVVEAKREAADRFQSSLDEISKQYSQNLANMDKIYSAIADRIGG